MSGSKPCRPAVVSAALRSSFHLTDKELAGTEEGEYVGATAVVAVVGRQHIWVAHCGESQITGLLPWARALLNARTEVPLLAVT